MALCETEGEGWPRGSHTQVSLVVKVRIADVIDSLLFFTETSWNLSSFTGNDLQLINSTDTLHLQILDL